MRAFSVGLMTLALVISARTVQAQYIWFSDPSLAELLQPGPLPEPAETLAAAHIAPVVGPIETASATYDVSSSFRAAPIVEEPVPASALASYGRTYVQMDGLFWHRAGSGCSEVLALNTGSVTPRAVLDTNDPSFNLTGGVRALVGWTPNCCSHCTAWELSYFGLYGWQANASAVDNNNLTIPGDLGAASNNFLNADRIAANYQSDFHNLELNCIKSCCVCDGTIDFLAGVRIINLNETFTLIGDDSADEGVGTYTINTNNYLYGLQLGGRYTRNWCNWSMQLIGKGGVFLNDATQSQQVLDSPFTGGTPFQLRSAIAANGNSVAGLGELGVVAIRPINDVWSFRVGYTALGIGGLALAPDQLDFTDAAGVSGSNLNMCGFVFLHGGLAGLQASW
jgi:hypothetical protein